MGLRASSFKSRNPPDTLPEEEEEQEEHECLLALHGMELGPNVERKPEVSVGGLYSEVRSDCGRSLLGSRVAESISRGRVHRVSRQQQNLYPKPKGARGNLETLRHGSREEQSAGSSQRGPVLPLEEHGGPSPFGGARGPRKVCSATRAC